MTYMHIKNDLFMNSLRKEQRKKLYLKETIFESAHVFVCHTACHGLLP